MSEPLELSEFEPATLEAWQKRVEADSGKPMRLGSTLDDVELDALYATRAPQTFETGIGARTPVAIGMEYTVTDPRRLAAALRTDFGYGLESGWVRLHPSSRCRVRVADPTRTGALIGERPELAGLLETVPAHAQLSFDAGANALSVYSMVLEASVGNSPRADVLSDPLGAWVETGRLGVSIEDALEDQAKLVSRAKVESPHLRVLLASGTMFHDAGASAATEVGAIVATAIEYVRSLATRGHDPADTLPRLVLRCCVDSDVLESLAKVRALRHLWRRVCGSLVGEAAQTLAPRLTVRAGWRNRTRHDPWINLVRGTAEGFAAITGGADEVCFAPCSEVVGVPAKDQRRWAIGTGLILREESHLANVHDPAAGSGAVEALTGALVTKAWTFVREIERAGGMAVAIDKGLPQKAAAAAAHQRRQTLARSKLVLTGVTLYPKLDEGTLIVSPVMEPVDPPEYPEVAVEQAMALEAVRLAEPFERLRDNSVRYHAEHGEFPSALIVELGDPEAHRGRLDFVRSTVSVGGFAPSVVQLANLPESPPAHTKLVVLCATDAVLEQSAVAAAATLRGAGYGPVIIAASPRKIAESVRECADGFFHQGTEIVSVMSDLQADQGVGQ